MTGPETDLERIDAALAEGRASASDPRERELQELALALRADSPDPAPAFAAELDRRVAAGFPKPKRTRGRLALPSFWIPALGAASLIVVALVVALASGGGGSDRSSNGTVAAVEQPSKDVAGAPPISNLSGGSGGSGAPALASSRHVERSVELTITTAHDKLQEAADGVGTIAESHGGFVLTSHVDTGDQGSGGTFTLRVPQRQLQATVADISKLGHLKARSESGQDVTAPYNDVQDKLGNALLEKRALKLKLKHAKGAKADAIRLRIETLNAAIDSLSGRMKNLKQRTVYSTLNVTLEQSKDQAGGTGAAWDDAQRTLEGMLNFALRALAVILPLALIAGLAALAGRPLRRRRREAPLL
jgi:hypothetical protein